MKTKSGTGKFLALLACGFTLSAGNANPYIPGEAVPPALRDIPARPGAILPDTIPAPESVLSMIDWGELSAYFRISHLRIGGTEYGRPVARLNDTRAVMFTAECKMPMAPAMVQAQFFDPKGQEIPALSFVSFTPVEYRTWHAGERFEASFPLLVDMTKVAQIRLTLFHPLATN